MNFKSDQYYFIISIDEDDQKDGIRTIFDNIVKPRCETKNLGCEYIVVSDSVELIRLIDRIERETLANSTYPYLHLECHGNEDGIKLKSGSRIKWDELRKLFTKINIASKNNLVISMAACYGGYFTFSLIKSIETINGCRSVALAIVGPDNEISDYNLDLGFASYFNEFLESRNLNKALERLNIDSKYEGKYLVDTNSNTFKFVIEFYVQKMLTDHFDSIQQVQEKMRFLEEDFLLKQRRRMRDDERLELRRRIFDKKFYLNFFNEMRHKYFLIDLHPENDKRFPMVDDIDGFDEKINSLSIE